MKPFVSFVQLGRFRATEAEGRAFSFIMEHWLIKKRARMTFWN